jgi:hypothetical protein
MTNDVSNRDLMLHAHAQNEKIMGTLHYEVLSLLPYSPCPVIVWYACLLVLLILHPHWKPDFFGRRNLVGPTYSTGQNPVPRSQAAKANLTLYNVVAPGSKRDDNIFYEWVITLAS